MAYSTEEDQRVASDLGYAHERSTNRGCKFTKGQRHIWSIYELRTYTASWQTADLIDNRFTNHQAYESLTEALRRELS